MPHALRLTVIWLISSSSAFAQDRPRAVRHDLKYDLTVEPRRIEAPVLKLRLLPAEGELREGNAATILLRLPWDLTNYLATEAPKFDDYLKIPLSDAERILEIGEVLPERFFPEMRRAAYRRTAEWEYPLREGLLADIPLPDVQQSRTILGRGLSVWIRFQIASGQLDPAREGILVGLADIRHIARTPFLITQLVASANANMMLDRLDELLQQPDCPNFYWALTALPAPFLNVRGASDFERSCVSRSVEGLDDIERPRTDDQWHELAERTYRLIEIETQPELSPEQIAAVLRRIAELARNYTGKAFEYNGGPESFALSAPPVEIGPDAIHGMVYEVVVKKNK